MTVYVDDSRNKYGRMIMCHMLATTEAELHAMADRIGIARKWFQCDHYDICLAKRAEAVAAGAWEITKRQAAVRRRNYDNGSCRYCGLSVCQNIRCRFTMPDDGDD